MCLTMFSFCLQRDGQYRIDSQATPTMLNCLMYKLSYYRSDSAVKSSGFYMEGTIVLTV